MNDKNSAHKRKLIRRYVNNTASEKELQSLFGMIGADEINTFIEADMDREIESMNRSADLEKLSRKAPWYKYIAASLIFISLSAAAAYFISGSLDKNDALANSKKAIVPGGNAAYLTLTNGKRIALTDMANGTVVKEPGVEITKTNDGQLVYKLSDVDHEKGNNHYNTIETPRGGQYQILLPDGSKVWLNASSSLKYPPSFAALKERTVELTGEAYFEVHKDKSRPFIVKNAKQAVEVLGTHFNINAYTDEPEVKTTLIEGAVRVAVLKNDIISSDYKMIRPGEQSVLTGSEIKIRAVETDESIAWKNGQFMFSSESIMEIMRKISRWYNVDVDYQGNVSEMKFTGTISRYANVSQVLQMLEMTNKVHFKIKGRIIEVTKPIINQ
jgi:transmembrane sensor